MPRSGRRRQGRCQDAEAGGIRRLERKLRGSNVRC
jgi:hypothetical protein